MYKHAQIVKGTQVYMSVSVYVCVVSGLHQQL